MLFGTFRTTIGRQDQQQHLVPGAGSDPVVGAAATPSVVNDDLRPVTSTQLLVLIVSMVFTALCAGLEIAIVSCNKLYVELKRKEGAIWARLVAPLLKRPGRVISALLVGNNTGLVVYGLVMADVLTPMLHEMHTSDGVVLVLETVIETLIILVVSEFIPKALFRLDPNFTLSIFALPLRLLYVILWPPTIILTLLSDGLLSLFGAKLKHGEVAFGRIDLDAFLKEVTDSAPADTDLDSEGEYFRNTLELSNIKVRDLMVPRAEVEAIDVEDAVADLHRRFTETGLSKLLVYKDSVDNMVGYVHSYELFRKPRSIRAVMRPVHFVPGTMSADEALQRFTRQRTHVAVVVDEFGGTAGILTIEDVVETIVGDIEDEHDEGELVEERLGEREFVLSARVETERLREHFGLNFPISEDYDTLAGWILHLTGEVPEQGTVIEEGPFKVTVAQVEHGRIDLVKLEVVEKEEGFVE
ncbi:MAG TPA: hemolysin family protein [Flavobacteriales bacterium]|nr:hemolysin family protein [Flavobacteriales bacterium]